MDTVKSKCSLLDTAASDFISRCEAFVTVFLVCCEKQRLAMKLVFLSNSICVKITSPKAGECVSTAGTFPRCCRQYHLKWKLISRSSGKTRLNQEMSGFVVAVGFAPIEAKLTAILLCSLYGAEILCWCLERAACSSACPQLCWIPTCS